MVVPPLLIVPPVEVMTLAEEAVKLADPPFVNVPAKEKFEVVVTVADAAVCRLKNVGAEPEVTIDDPLFKVIVPALGAKAAVVVSAPVTVAVVEAVMAALIFNPEYVVLFIDCPELVYSTVKLVRVLVVKAY